MLYDWLFERIRAGPPDESELVVIEDDYRYRCFVHPDIEAEFIVLVHERRMLIKRFVGPGRGGHQTD